MRILFLGDVHGNAEYIRSLKDYISEQEIDRIIQVGDLGILWDTTDPDKCEVAQAIHELDTEFWFIDGNHDNHHNIRGMDQQITDLIRYIPRGSVEEIDGLKFGFLGGAYSIDKKWRTKDVDWWDIEEPTEEEAELLLDKDLDILITHDAPYSVHPLKLVQLPKNEEEASEKTRILIDKVMYNNNPSRVFCGHWHQNHIEMVGSTKVTILDMEDAPGNIMIFDTKELHEPA